jgi:hypothetical protein
MHHLMISNVSGAKVVPVLQIRATAVSLLALRKFKSIALRCPPMTYSSYYVNKTGQLNQKL